MKKYIKLFFIIPMLVLASCDSESLEVLNPNEPTLVVLDSEEGLYRTMLGSYVNGLWYGYIWIAATNHNIMGDATFVPWGNFAWRYANQPARIILDDGAVVTPPTGTTQPQELISRNDRAQGDDNAFKWEWETMYNLNNTGNLLLEKLDGGSIDFSGDAATKEKIVRAWAYWWKGFAYSRIGSLYSAGVINSAFGQTNGQFVTREEIIAEANSNLNEAKSLLGTVSDDETYQTVMNRAIPDYLRPNGVPSPGAWVGNINTMLARNLLVNKKLKDMTSADWGQIKSLTEQGLQQTDNIFEYRTADENDILIFRTAWSPYRILIGWEFISERLIQDFKEGDARFTRNIYQLDAPDVNIRGRGIQYGTRWGVNSIEDGGDWASVTSGSAMVPIAGSWEENHLMLAEALIQTGDSDGGLALIDEVRTAQDAQLPAAAGTGLDKAAAYEELRRERRIGLFLSGLAFYDARRWGVIDPVSAGGGRAGAVVLDAAGNLHTNATFDYSYLNYFGVSDNELDFNAPQPGSADVNAQ